MRVYQIKKSNNTKNVFGISLVATPAMESNYVQLSAPKSITEKIELSKKNDLKFSVINKEKRLLLGLVLEPEKLIYRYNENTKEEYYLTATAETVLELQQDYIKQSNQSYSTLEHDGRELDGVTFTEHWIVEDSKIDKSAVHGLTFQKGSWVSVAKIENDTLWNEYIKTGVVMGFSIDAIVHLEEINLNKQLEMSETKTILGAISDLGNKIALAFEPKEKVEKKYEDMTDEEKAAFDKKKAAKKDDGKVALKTETAEKVVTVKADAVELSEINKAVKDLSVELSTIVGDALKPIQDANLALTKQVEALGAKTVELAKELAEKPTSKTIVTNPTSVDLASMNNREKMIHNWENR